MYFAHPAFSQFTDFKGDVSNLIGVIFLCELSISSDNLGARCTRSNPENFVRCFFSVSLFRSWRLLLSLIKGTLLL